MSRVRTNTFHHCLVPVQAVTNNLETFDDLRQLCGKVAECDVGASEGPLAVSRYTASRRRLRRVCRNVQLT